MTEYGSQSPAAPEITLKLGTVVHDEAGGRWVFCGYVRTTVSHQLSFVKGETISSLVRRYEYHATSRDTLARKFPDILKHETERDIEHS